MGLQPSASRTALLLTCPRPFDPNIEADPDLPGEPARYGSAFHSALASCLKTSAKKPLERSARYARVIDKATAEFDVRSARAELAGHVKSSVKVLRNWLAREKLEVAEIEKAYAVRPYPNGTWTTRSIPAHDESHRYDVEPDMVPGTVDLVAKSASRMVVIDHKTGGEDHGFATPASMPQMRTLGLGAAGVTKHAEVGIFHADRRGLPIMYAEPYEPSEQKSHARALSTSLSLVGTGFLRPGPHCARCPARITCPAHAADLLAESTAALVEGANKLALEPINPRALHVLPTLVRETDALGASLEERAGVLYEVLKKFRVLEKAGSDEIKRLVKSGAVVETRDGSVLAIQTQTYETLSKKSVLEALGKIAGERELARLRKKGAIVEATREKLIPEK
jgi:hypothetical protein